MASKIQEDLLESFVEASGEQAKDLEAIAGDGDPLIPAIAPDSVTAPATGGSLSTESEPTATEVIRQAAETAADVAAIDREAPPSVPLDDAVERPPEPAEPQPGPLPQMVEVANAPEPASGAVALEPLNDAFEQVAAPAREPAAVGAFEQVAAPAREPAAVDAFEQVAAPVREPAAAEDSIGAQAGSEAASPALRGPEPQPSSAASAPEAAGETATLTVLSQAIQHIVGFSAAQGSAETSGGQAAAGAPGGTGTGGEDGTTGFSAAWESVAGGDYKPSTTTQSTDGGGAGSTIESIVTNFFESGLGLVPLIGGLLGLFGGGSSTPAPAPAKYEMPTPLDFEAVDTGQGMADSDYDQMGMPRPYTDPADGGAAPAANSESPGGAGSGGSTAAPPQITVNVQAMDARSFLDRSSDIAEAVRQAMLNLSSINDVVNDL